MKRYVTFFIVVCSFLFSNVAPLHAEMRLGGQASYGSDTDMGIGVRASLGLDQMLSGLEIIGSFDWFFPDLDADDVDYTYFEVNGNFIYNFSLQQTTLIPYAGGGVNLAHGSLDSEILGDDEVEVSDTEVGFNLLGGVTFELEKFRPFLECRLEIGGGEQVVVTGGVLF